MATPSLISKKFNEARMATVSVFGEPDQKDHPNDGDADPDIIARKNRTVILVSGSSLHTMVV